MRLVRAAGVSYDRTMRRPLGFLVVLATIAAPATAAAYGEEVAGFPNWAERVEHEWSNRARVDPSIEMAKCGAKCGEAACYKAVGPVWYSEMLNRAARFHSSEMIQRKFFAHDSNCKLVTTLKTTYPTSCKGETACACEGGALTGTTSFGARVGIWAGGASGEIIASGTDPNGAFYQWLYENSTSTTCAFSSANGHRWLILTGGPGIGYGVDGYSTGDFGGAPEKPKIPSGSHYPRSGTSVELWANWYDTAGPSSALVNVGGTCQSMKLTRGTVTNGAYLYTAAGTTGCTRYYFQFKDSTGAQVTYPTTGSLGIGDATCADWSATRPAAGAGCDCKPSCTSKTCGDDGCGGSCGTCKTGETCSAAGACVAAPPPDAGPTDTGVPPTDTGTPAGDTGTPTGDGGTGDGSTPDGSTADGGTSGPDGGPDGSALDGGVDPDAGGPGAAADGDVQGTCGCRAVGATGTPSTLLGLGALGLLGLAIRMRRR